MRYKTFRCRFPGCDWKAIAPQPRGRHESQAHGMVKGELPPKYTTINGAPKLPHVDVVAEHITIDERGVVHAASASGNGHMSPVEHLTAAYADLAEREKVLAAESDRLAKVQAERETVHRHMAVINAALEDIGERKA